MKEKAIPKKVKGTVLFTVVAVMMVLIVFLMGTLALAATANNRAMNSYNSAQTQATARAAVEAVLASMQNDMTIAQTVSDVDAAHPLMIGQDQIVFNDPALGRVESVVIESVGERYQLDNDVNSDTYGELISLEVIKITATVSQGRENTTVSAYLLKGDAPPGGGGGGGGGFVSVGSAVNGTKTSAFGGTYIGFDVAQYGADMWVSNSNTVFESDLQVNGNLGLGTGLDLVIKEPGTGITVWKNLYAKGLYIATVNATTANMNAGNYSYTDIPYLYVEGVLEVGADRLHTRDNTPLKIYCGQFISEGADYNANADIYCYSKVDGSTTHIEYKDNTNNVQRSKDYATGMSEFMGDRSNLYRWVDDFVSTDGSTHTGGNFYSKGSLKLSSNGGSTFQKSVYLEGDLLVTNGNHTIQGDLYVGGAINVTGGKVTVNGNIYCDSISGTVEGTKNALRQGGHYELNTAEYEVVVKYAEFKTDFQINNTGNGHGWVIPNADGAAWVIKYESETDLLAAGYCKHGNQNLQLDEANGTFTWTCTNHTPHLNTTGNIPTYSLYYRKADGQKVTEAEACNLVDDHGNPIAAPAIFPAEYEKDIILGDALLPGTTSTDSSKIIETRDDIMRKIDPFNTSYDVEATYKQTVDDHAYILGGRSVKDYSYAAVADTSFVEYKTKDAGDRYEGDNGSYIIKNSCKIKGNLDKENLIFKVPTNSEIWVQIDELNCSNGVVFVLDDREVAYQGKLNILINGNVNFAATNNLSGNPVITSTTIQDIKESGEAFQINTNPNWRRSHGKNPGSPMPKEIQEIKINVYCAKGPGNNGYRLTSANTGYMAANIRAPYLRLNLGSATPTWNNDIFYNGFNIKDSTDYTSSTTLAGVNIIGCCIIHELEGQANDFVLLYVPSAQNPANPPVAQDALMNRWTLLYYENY